MALRITICSATKEESVPEMLKCMLEELQKNILQEFIQFKQTIKEDIEQLRIDIKADMDQVKRDLRASIAQIKTEVASDSEFIQFKQTLKEDIEQLRIDIKADMDQVKRDLKADIAQIKTEVASDSLSDTNSGESEEKFSAENAESQDKLDMFMAEQEELQQKICMFMEHQEQKVRDLNLRLVGLPEESNENTILKVQHYVKDKMKVETPGITDAFRVGKVSDQPRHVIVRFQSRRERLEVIRKRTLLKGSNVWINEDLTKAQYQKHKEDMARLKEARHNGKRAYWRNGKVVIEHPYWCDGCSTDILGCRWHCNVCTALQCMSGFRFV